jgi:hypothetical protein
VEFVVLLLCKYLNFVELVLLVTLDVFVVFVIELLTGKIPIGGTVKMAVLDVIIDLHIILVTFS